MRDRLRALRRSLRFQWELRRLPWRVAIFQWRAWRLAAQLDDEFARVSATTAKKLEVILEVAGDGRLAVELGTAHAWTAISLALADPNREVISYDAIERPGPQQYLELVPEQVRQRVTLIAERGDSGPKTDRPVDLLYIDTTHDRDDTLRELGAWRPVLRDGAWVVLDDYIHPDYPGVKEAVSELQLDGEERAGMFTHRILGRGDASATF
jgi:predicted O-methyltransferase YrrM